MQPTGLLSTDAHWILRSHLVHLSDKCFRVLGDLSRQTKLIELVAHDILEDGTAHSYTNGHAQSTHESVHGSRATRILNATGGLDADVDASQQHAVADAKDSQNDSPDGGLGVLAEENQQTAGNGGDNAAAPDGPAVAAQPGRHQRDDDATGEEEASHGEDVQAGARRAVELDGSEVEGDVVEGAEEL